jgi:hypothetical protein
MKIEKPTSLTIGQEGDNYPGKKPFPSRREAYSSTTGYND